MLPFLLTEGTIVNKSGLNWGLISQFSTNKIELSLHLYILRLCYISSVSSLECFNITQSYPPFSSSVSSLLLLDCRSRVLLDIFHVLALCSAHCVAPIHTLRVLVSEILQVVNFIATKPLFNLWQMKLDWVKVRVTRVESDDLFSLRLKSFIQGVTEKPLFI